MVKLANKTTAECFRCEDPDKYEADAIKALGEGAADEYQQKIALNYIVNKLCRSNDVLYVHGNNSLDTAFLNGRAFPGQKILKILKVPIGRLKLKETEEVIENG